MVVVMAVEAVEAVEEVMIARESTSAERGMIPKYW